MTGFDTEGTDEFLVQYELKHTEKGSYSIAATASANAALDELMRRDLLRHVHNLRANALHPLFDAFRLSVLTSLPLNKRALVTSCDSFSDFTDIMIAFGTKSEEYRSIMEASKPFCEEYNVVPSFWVQVGALWAMIRECNNLEHCSVGQSASEVKKLLDSLDSSDTAYSNVVAILDALAQFGMKNSAELDVIAEEKCAQELGVMMEYRRRRAARKLASHV